MMDKDAWAIFFGSALDNKLFVSMNCIFEALFVAASVAFSVVLAIAFGFDVFGLTTSPVLSFLLRDRLHLLLTALLLALLALLARVAANAVDAHVHSSQEIWFARKMRASGVQLDGNTAGRASNHYGRLAAASMNAASCTIVLLGNVIVLAFVIPFHWVLAILGIVALFIVLLGYLFVRASQHMRNSAIDLVDSARSLSSWKLSSDSEDPPELRRYQRAYFLRIFLSSLFSYSTWIFAISFCVVLLLFYEAGVNLELGEAFVGFTVVQMFLGLIGRVFNSAIKAAAFAPAVRRVMTSP